MKYEFIRKYQDEFAVGGMCRVLGVSRSGYYHWLGRKPSSRACEDEVLAAAIRRSHEESRQIYGVLRILRDLIAWGYRCGKKRLRRLMRKMGIRAKIAKKFKVTTHSAHGHPISPNLLKTAPLITGPDQVWVSDITYLWTQEGWLYLAIVLDLYSRKIVGWAISTRLKADLVINAFEQAVSRRRPPAGLIFHSDHGVQYACEAFREKLKKYGALSSMGAKGYCYDNAYAESFFHSFKTEWVYGYDYQTRNQARASIFEYIEIIYNRIRRHSALGYQSPDAFEMLQMAA
jgi:transposase InsO family protein